MNENDNRHSLPHPSDKSGYHLDVYSNVEGKQQPQKFHESLDQPQVDPKSIEGLRQRLGSQKGY